MLQQPRNGADVWAPFARRVLKENGCLKDVEEAKALRRKWRWFSVRIGWLPAFLTFIPFIGWLFLPLSITYEVVGFAFLAEQSRNS